MSQLFSSVRPHHKKRKELLIFGYYRLNSLNALMLTDVIHLCQSFCDETLVWRINTRKLQQQNKEICADEWFYCRGVGMRWLFEPNPSSFSEYGDDVVALRLELASESVKF